MLLLRHLALVVLLGVSVQAADQALLRNGFFIRHERREVAGEVTRLYLSAAPDSGYVEVPSAEIVAFEREEVVPGPGGAESKISADDIAAFIRAASDQHRLDPDLIAAVIAAESAFDPGAVSPKGAQGLMQLMPATASELGVSDAFDPAANVEAGTRYLRRLLADHQNDLARALAAYNAGPHRVAQHNGVPPYRETRAYVIRVIREFNRRKLAQRREARVGEAPPAPAATD